MHRVYLSDLHLNNADEPQFRTLAALLRVESRRVDAIYILGDLCEAWVGDDDDSPFADALRAALLDAASHARVLLMHGNRDFLLGRKFVEDCNSELIDDPHRVDADTLLSHGDAFCVDDEEYQQVRALLRSPAWQQDVLNRSLAERRELARSMRAQSIATNANKPDNITDVAADEVTRVVAEHGANRLIHGHTHRPGVHLTPWGRRYVLGSWERCGWLMRDRDTSAQLECFALSGRYET